MVGGMGVKVGDGVRVGVFVPDAVTVGVKVRVKVLVAVAVNVSLIVGVPVGVTKSSAKAAMVIALSVLSVGVSEPSPVFGMTRSELYSFCAVALVTMNGRLNATIHTSSKITTMESSIFFTERDPFLSGP